MFIEVLLARLAEESFLCSLLKRLPSEMAASGDPHHVTLVVIVESFVEEFRNYVRVA
jgi:hypothetical protein